MYAEGHSFFTYLSDNADSLSSCCRLRNEIQDNGFSYTLGAGGVSTGSKSVLTINLNRCIQYGVNHDGDFHPFLEHVIDLCHKVQLAYNENLKELQAHGMLPLFDAAISTSTDSISPSASTDSWRLLSSWACRSRPTTTINTSCRTSWAR
jgi:hypothetical protein